MFKKAEYFVDLYQSQFQKRAKFTFCVVSNAFGINMIENILIEVEVTSENLDRLTPVRCHQH